jgi:hypothetical protein
MTAGVIVVGPALIMVARKESEALGMALAEPGRQADDLCNLPH